MTEPLAQEAYVAFVQICKGGSDDAGTYDADEALVRRALKRLDELESAARRPKPPSLKEQGREALERISNSVVMATGGAELDALKAIVEQLPD